MSLLRNEIRTGLFVVVSLGLIAAVLVYYGAAGDFQDRKRFQVYFDDAGGIQAGASVTLSGRKVGQVRRMVSPVPEADRPEPQLEVLIEVEVSITSRIYREQQVTMLQYGMLGDQLIDFSRGSEQSGVAPDGSFFIGKRQPGINDAVPQLLGRIDPLVNEATALVRELRTTADHLNKMTADDSDFNKAVTGYKETATNLKKLTGEKGHLAKALKNLDDLTGEKGGVQATLGRVDLMVGSEGDLAVALKNFRDFTAALKGNTDIAPMIANFRRAGGQLNATLASLHGTVEGITPCVNETVKNAAQFTDTLKRQPWRLIWPSTKKYPEDEKKKKKGAFYVVETTEETFLPVAERAGKLERPLWGGAKRERKASTRKEEIKASSRRETEAPKPSSRQKGHKEGKERKKRPFTPGWR